MENENRPFRRLTLTKVLTIILIVAVAFISIAVLEPISSDKSEYEAIAASLEEKKDTVTKITLAADAASIAIASIPGDATTPLAEKVLDVASILVIVIGALVLEKVLLTSFGFITFKVLIPIACGLLLIYVLNSKVAFKVLAIKIFVFALVLVNIVPASIKISNYIYEANNEAITQLSDGTQLPVIGGIQQTENNEESKSWLSQVISGFKTKLETGTDEAINYAKEVSNKFIMAVAILILTTCVIPMLVVFTVLWLLKFLFGGAVPIENISFVNLMAKDRRHAHAAENE